MWRRWIHAIPARLAALFRTRRLERDLDDELAFHVAMQARANAGEGMGGRDADRRARAALGGVEQVKERSRDIRPMRWLHDALRDVRDAVRALRQAPRFTMAAVLTVVLGVGANATIFSVVNPLLFKPLPYPEPDRIVGVFRTSPQSDRWPHAMGNYLDHRARNEVFDELATFTWETRTLPTQANPLSGCSNCGPAATSSPCSAWRRSWGARTPMPMICPVPTIEGRETPLAYNERVTPQYFDTLGIPLRRGRGFTADDQFGRTPMMIISESMARALWPGEDPIGKRIGFQGPNPNWREVVGVAGDVTFPAFGVSADVDTAFTVYQPVAQTGVGAVNVLVRTDRA